MDRKYGRRRGTKEKIFFLSENSTISTSQAYETINTICGENIPKDIATLVLASLIIETNNFRDNASEENLSLGSALIGFGADKETIRAIIKKDMTFLFVIILIITYLVYSFFLWSALSSLTGATSSAFSVPSIPSIPSPSFNCLRSGLHPFS